MRRYATALLFSCVCALAVDDIGVTTTTKTNAQSGAVITKQFFTRGGQTNLLRSTTSTNGVVKSRLHRFYHDGRLIADHLTAPALGYSLVTTHGGYSLTFESETNALTDVYLADTNGNTLDAFASTNGVLTPIPTSELRKMTNSVDRIKAEIEKEAAK